MTCCDLIDTIAMIGSPASRGATASTGAFGRAGLAAASAQTGVSRASAASVTMAWELQRRIATVDRVVGNRIAMPMPRCVLRACVENCHITTGGLTNFHAANSLPEIIGTFRWRSSLIRQPRQEEGQLAREIGAFFGPNAASLIAIDSA